MTTTGQTKARLMAAMLYPYPSNEMSDTAREQMHERIDCLREAEVDKIMQIPHQDVLAYVLDRSGQNLNSARRSQELLISYATRIDDSQYSLRKVASMLKGSSSKSTVNRTVVRDDLCEDVKEIIMSVWGDKMAALGLSKDSPDELIRSAVVLMDSIESAHRAGDQ